MDSHPDELIQKSLMLKTLINHKNIHCSALIFLRKKVCAIFSFVKIPVDNKSKKKRVFPEFTFFLNKLSMLDCSSFVTSLSQICEI